MDGVFRSHFTAHKTVTVVVGDKSQKINDKCESILMLGNRKQFDFTDKSLTC